jgi:hypothetical protein
VTDDVLVRFVLRARRALECRLPQYKKVVRKAQTGIADGEHAVGSGKNEIRPGTYRNRPKVRDRYGECTDDRGNILASDLVAYSPMGAVVTFTGQMAGSSPNAVAPGWTSGSLT